MTVLGSAGTFATRDRAASGYLVQLDDANLWLDAGAGTWRNLLGYIDYPDLGGIVLTHRHPDHTTDVFQAHHALHYGQAEPLPKIPLFAPQETLDRVSAFAQVDESFDLRPVSAGDSVELFGATISFFRMAHIDDTVGVRIEFGGGVFAYSADTGPAGDLDGLTKGADLFICEATYQETDGGRWSGHMQAGEAGRIAMANGVPHLVLSHLPQNVDLGLTLQQASREAKGATIELADDGKRYEVIG